MTDILIKFLTACAHVLDAHTLAAAPAAAAGPNWLDAFFDGFTWTQGGIIIAALIAATGVMATIITTSGRARRERLTDMYAEALSGVSQYIEGPYRIRRRTVGNADQRVAITTFLSDVKARMDHSQNMLNLHAPAGVGAAYKAYVSAAMREAGQQMHEAWTMPGIKHDLDVNLRVAYPKVGSDAMRAHLMLVIGANLAFRRRLPQTWLTPSRTTKAAATAAKAAAVAAATKRQSAEAARAAHGPSKGRFSRAIKKRR
jgi:hypothetical protein